MTTTDRLGGLPRAARALSIALSIALAGAILPPRAVADMVPSPPPPVAVTASQSVLGARSGGPERAQWTVRNDGRAPVRLRVERVVCVLSSMRLPIQIAGVRVDGRAIAGRELELAPGASASVEVTFAALAGGGVERQHEWTFELGMRATGERAGYVSGATTVRRIPFPG